MNNNHCLKDFIKYCSLNVLGMLGLSCYILADTFFVANGIGPDGLTALNLAIPVYNFIHGTGLMLGIGAATKFSIFHSQDHTDEGNKFFTITVLLAALSSIIYILIGAFLSDDITYFLGANDTVFDMTNTYMKIMLLFSPAFIFNDVFVCFVRNDGNPKLAMIGMLVGSITNIIMDYIFIYPLQMGIFGAVLATGFSPVISMLILSLHIIRKNNHFRFVRLNVNELLSGRILNILSLGIPSLISEVSSGVVIIIFNMIILDIEGNIGVAAYGVIANISLVVVAIYTGISQGIQPLLCNAYGVGEQKNIKAIMNYSMVTLISLSALLYAFLYVFADPVTAAFNSDNNATLQTIAVDGIKLYFTSVLFVGFNIIISTLFTSIEKPVPAQVITLLRGFFVIIPVAFIFAALFGMTGVWLAFPVTELIVMLVAVIFIYPLRRR